MVCACFAEACPKFMRSISAASCKTWETKTLFLSVKMSARKKACLVMISIVNFAVFTAVGLETE